MSWLLKNINSASPIQLVSVLHEHNGYFIRVTANYKHYNDPKSQINDMLETFSCILCNESVPEFINLQIKLQQLIPMAYGRSSIYFLDKNLDIKGIYNIDYKSLYAIADKWTEDLSLLLNQYNFPVIKINPFLYHAAGFAEV